MKKQKNQCKKHVGADAYIRPAQKEYLKNTGITLIALVITIIVLLILAGVTLSLVAGGNGIIGKAEKALTETQKAALKEATELALAELQMEYYLNYDGNQTFEDFIKEKCGTEGFETSNGGRFYVDDEGKLVYENDDGSVLISDENGVLVPDEIISNMGEDTTAPQISTLTSTNSITIVVKDRASGVAAYAITESESEPSDWTTVPKTKRLEETITGKARNTTYYVWAKDASGNISHKSAKTLDFEAFASTVAWEGNLAVITVTSPITGVQFNTGAGWQDYSDENKPRVASGTTVQFRITDGTNTQTCTSVQPLKKSTVRYDLNGGTGTLPANVEKTHNDRVVVDTTATLTKTGYTFLGWARESNATAGITEFSMPGEDVTLYAVWSINSYSITYNANTGANAPVSQSANYGETVNINFSTVPTKTGYTFLGYATTNNATSATYTSGGTKTINITENVTLYAVWKINTYTVTYNINNGTGSVPSAVTQNYNTTVNVSFSPLPTRTNYTFQGWATTSGATSATYTSSGTKTFTLTNNVTLYAVWKINTYTITYNANGGSGSVPANQSVVAGENATINMSVKPSKSDFDMIGWSTSSNYTTGSNFYTNMSGFYESSGLTLNSVTSNVTLYAVYGKKVTVYESSSLSGNSLVIYQTKSGLRCPNVGTIRSTNCSSTLVFQS